MPRGRRQCAACTLEFGSPGNINIQKLLNAGAVFRLLPTPAYRWYGLRARTTEGWRIFVKEDEIVKGKLVEFKVAPQGTRPFTISAPVCYHPRAHGRPTPYGHTRRSRSQFQ